MEEEQKESKEVRIPRKKSDYGHIETHGDGRPRVSELTRGQNDPLLVKLMEGKK